MGVLIFVILAIILLAFVEFLKRALSFSTNVTRRLAHLGAGCIGIATPLFATQQEIIIVNLIFAGLLLVGRNKNYLSSIHKVGRYSYGDVYLPLGIAIAATVFLPHSVLAFQYGVAIMAISDALAGLVGERYGTHKISFFNLNKTIEGSITFFVVSVALTFIFVPNIGVMLIVIPIILTVSELSLVYGLDNLVLPILAGVLILGLT